MSEKKFVGKGIKIKYSGVFDFNDLYRKMKYWLDFDGYGDEKKNFDEIKYIERVKPDGKQIEIAWKAKKSVNDYLINWIEVTFFIVGLQKVEVEKDGKKIGMNKGDVEMRFTGYLEVNPGRDDSLFDNLYKKYIIKDRIDQHLIDLYNKFYSFMDEAKNYLNLQRF